MFGFFLISFLPFEEIRVSFYKMYVGIRVQTGLDIHRHIVYIFLYIDAAELRGLRTCPTWQQQASSVFLSLSLLERKMF
jgi:hypothetical protein